MLDVKVMKIKGDFKLDTEIKVDSGELLVILGPSGCGKTTLLNIIAGFQTPDSGEVLYGDRVLFSKGKKVNRSINERGIGYIQQESCLFPHLNVKENILYGIPKKIRRSKENHYRELLKVLEIESLEESKIFKISGGQQQRVAMARTLIMNPKLVLWDEPFSSLDHAIRKDLRKLVTGISKENRAPMIFVTHDLEEAFEIGDKIAVMKDGRVLQMGTTEDLINNPISREVEKILGISHGEIKKPYVIAVHDRDAVDGKSIIDSLIKGLKKTGLSVGVIKNETDIVFSEDAQKSQEADGVIILQKGKYTMVQRKWHDEVSLEDLIALHKGLQVIFIKGFPSSGYPVVEVIGKKVQDNFVLKERNTMAVFTEEDVQTGGIPKFHWKNEDEFVGYIHSIVKEYYHER